VLSKNSAGPEIPTRTEALQRVPAAWLDTWVPPKSVAESPPATGTYYYHGLLVLLGHKMLAVELADGICPWQCASAR
jgi:hypothetical protein